MKNNQEEMTIEALKSLLEMVESLRDCGAKAFGILIQEKAPCNQEILRLGMLLQASLGFSIALKAWIELSEEAYKEDNGSKEGN